MLPSAADVIASAAIAGVVANEVPAAYVWPPDVSIGEVFYSLIGDLFLPYRTLQAPEDVLGNVGALELVSVFPAATRLMNAIVISRDYANTPGPTTFKAGGVMFGGYLGFTTATELISGTELASAIGLSAGTAQYSTDGWLKWMKAGKLMYVARKPQRHTISWDNINAVGAVFGTKTVVIQGKTYKVRLLTGGDASPASGAGGEWNEIIYGVHKDQEPNWDNYTDADIVVTSGDGRYSWCQETSASNSSDRVHRGYSSVTDFRTAPSSTVDGRFGWRPVLELVQ